MNQIQNTRVVTDAAAILVTDAGAILGSATGAILLVGGIA